MVESNKRLYYERRFFQYFLSIGISEKDLKENWYYTLEEEVQVIKIKIFH